MKKWKLWVGISLIFLAGLCIGAVSSGLYLRRQIESTFEEGSPRLAEIITRRLSRKLDLTADQQAAVEKVVREGQLRFREFRRRHRPEVQEIVGSSVAQIREQLSPQQQQRLDALYEKWKERWKSAGNNGEQPVSPEKQSR